MLTSGVTTGYSRPALCLSGGEGDWGAPPAFALSGHDLRSPDSCLEQRDVDVVGYDAVVPNDVIVRPQRQYH